jgi:hypothetical protein
MKTFLTGFGGAIYQPDVSYVTQAVRAEGWEQVSNLSEADVVFLSYSRSKFALDLALLSEFRARPRPTVVFDWTETHSTYGAFIGQSNFCAEEPANQLSQAVIGSVVGYFKRELRVNDAASFPVYPLDYPARKEFSTTPETEQEFINRPIACLMCCGFTSSCRMRLFSSLIRHAVEPTACAFSVNDVNVLLARKTPHIFALLHSLPGVRIPLEEVFALQQKSRLVVNLRGAGRKCMRDTEATANSCAAFQAPELLQWAYPWVAETNCIGLPHNNGTLLDTEAAVHLGQLAHTPQVLYPLYVQSIAHRANYYAGPYARNYLLPRIKKMV